MEEETIPEKKQSVSEREETVLAFWQEHKIFEKSLAQTEGKDPYIFYDGPPFATGLPHHGHLLQGTIKDIIPRYQTMRGRYVRRQWGWDCHGLPVENIIEQELGFKHKKDIEAYGIEQFNQKARASVLRYDKEWRTVVQRMGRWVDMEHEYKTMDATYTESVWWAFKTLFNKKLIYEGFKSMHICPRCETTLAASEVAQGYKTIKDISVYVTFEIIEEPGTHLIAWTTTPWTLPGNVALALNPDIVYLIVLHAGKRYVVAKERAALIFKDKEYTIIEERKGKTFLGLSYQPIFDYYIADEKLEHRENAWKVVGADFVTTESGTGIVHIAPAFGEDDMELAKKLKLPMIQHVRMDGTIKPEVTDFAGLHAKPKDDHTATDVAVIKVLAAKNVLFAKEKIEHSYPHCWRCDTPLLNYAASSWFVNVTALKPRLIEENKEINWIPEHIRDGRFGRWLEGARDWAISRSRYFGAPLPVWKCNTCDNIDVLGSLDDLRKKVSSANTYRMMRHGEADSNIRNIVSYKIEDDIHLTEKGRKEVALSATALAGKGIDLIISSPLLRTRETATIVAETLGLPVPGIIYDARIAEVNTGDFNGCSIETYRSYFTSTLEKFTKPSPGGETLEAMRLRVAEFLYDIEQTYQGKNILLVTHEYGVWMMDATLRGATNEEASWLRLQSGEDYLEYGEVRDFPFVPIPHNDRYELDFHRPFIDRVRFPCSCALGEMSRIPDIFDCWFESGSMPYARFHYMGDETTPEGKLFLKNFPADFVAEAVDQTRGWFYTMLILSVGLFDRAAFKSVIATGLILAEDGQKMSKKLKNYPDPMEVVEKYGADTLRFYMINSPVVRGEELYFSILGVDEVFKKITMRLDNVRAFYEMYAEDATIPQTLAERTNVLDKWMLARWQETHAEVSHHLDTHELDRATRLIMPLLEDLSTWYVRRSRDRFKHPATASAETLADRDQAIETTGWILLQVSKLLAPFMPFLAEDCYQRLHIEGKKESVHLEGWPMMGVSPHAILAEMEEVRRIVSLALEARAKAGIKVRQPLARLEIFSPTLKGKDVLLAIIAEEVNVKQVEVHVDARKEISVVLDISMTPELKEEGAMRDLIRTVQDLRKKAGLHPSDHIALTILKEQAPLLEKYTQEVLGTVGAVRYALGEEISVSKSV